jgi:hypothetical protein
MRRFPWDILLTLLAGLGLGLAYSWLVAPRGITDSTPSALRADFKDQYRAAVAAAYAANGNLPRAEARLSQLGDGDLVEALNAQAQRQIAGAEFAEADLVVALARALENGGAILPAAPTEPSVFIPGPTNTPPPTPEELPFLSTETPSGNLEEILPTATEIVIVTPTPRPTRTAVPTVSAPFALIAQDPVCDANLPDGLLQVMVFNSSRRQVAGARLIITWENGEEQFFTGLKPEIGNGYADFLMTPNVTYALRLAAGSDIAAGLLAPTCQTASGEPFLGGIKLTFQQP